MNWLVHIVAGLALFEIIRRTPGSAGGSPATRGGPAARARKTDLALAIGVLWLVHPLQTEAVSRLAPPGELLTGLIYLVTFFLFLRGTENEYGRVWLASSVVCCAVGMTTMNAVMLSAPLMVLLFDRCFVAGTFSAAWRRRRIFYLSLASTWLLFAWAVAQQGPPHDAAAEFATGASGWDFALTQFTAVGRYLRLSAWPHPLVFDYGVFWIDGFGDIALEVALVFALLAATIVALWRRSPFGFLSAWFFCLTVSTSFLSGSTQMIAEHRMYLPLAAIVAFAIAGLHAWLGPQRRLFMALVGLLALAFVLLTVRRHRDYRGDLTLWTDTVAKRPANAHAHFMLGQAQERAGNTAAAIASYAQTLELKPDFARGHEILGELLLGAGRRAEAIAHFESALRLRPDYLEAHAHLGRAYLADDRITEAIGHLERAAQLGPASASLHRDLAQALSAAGLADEAASHFEAAERLGAPARGIYTERR